MNSRIVSDLRESCISRFVRSKISKWPWYQSGHENGLFSHYSKMKIRVFLSFISDTLQMDRETRNKIRNTANQINSQKCPVLVIGNGPSSNSFTAKQYERFKNSGGKILVMNGFVDSPLAKFVVPDYYCLMDLWFWNPIHESELVRLSKIETMLAASNSQITFIQPANQKNLFREHKNYLFFDGRTTAGVRRKARPDKPWGIAGSVALMSIATLKFLGHEVIYFTGLDSDASRHFFVNDLNELLWDSRSYYILGNEESAERRETKIEEGIFKFPGGLVNNFYDLLHSDAIFRRDLMWLLAEGCVNVSDDRTNDAAPRASLLS